MIEANPSKNKYKTPVDLNELEDLMSNWYATSSEKTVKWAVKNYADWRLHSIGDGGNCDLKLFSADIHDVKSLDKVSFAFCMCKFIMEVIKVNGEVYPPNTLKELVYCIQMFLHTK